MFLERRPAPITKRKRNRFVSDIAQDASASTSPDSENNKMMGFIDDGESLESDSAAEAHGAGRCPEMGIYR